jgi:hypothetical protein
MWSKSLDLNTCPVPTSLRQFCSAIDKPKPACFWGPNQETVVVILRSKSPNYSYRFWGPNQETWVTGFEAKPRETVAAGFKAKPEKTVRVVLRSNHWQTVHLGFEAQPRNLRSSSPRAWCRHHIASPDLPIVQPPSTWPMRPTLVLCTKSPTPIIILVSALPCCTYHLHTTRPQMWFSNETKIKVK